MSELINNREHRQQELKKLILKLHNGADFDEVKREFEAMTTDVSASEITEMEQALVDEGMPVENIQKLCDVHAAIFKGSIADIHSGESAKKEDKPGHPVFIFRLENRKIESLLEGELAKSLEVYLGADTEDNKAAISRAMERLSAIDIHYKRKENLLFPLMEKYGITAPPQVMWGIHDEIRAKLKTVLAELSKTNADHQALDSQTEALIEQIKEMIFKEEKILFPMTLDAFNDTDWENIKAASDEIGYALIQPPTFRTTKSEGKADNGEKRSGAEKAAGGRITVDSKQEIAFDAGTMTAEELNAVLNTVPVDMTFVGADNRVKYFTQGKERIFERPLTIIGREVKNCHPPKSVHIVEQIVTDLRLGKKEHEDFWIKLNELFVYIRYFAVRSKSGEFLGVLEVSQNIKSITELEGEKRLMS